MVGVDPLLHPPLPPRLTHLTPLPSTTKTVVLLPTASLPEQITPTRCTPGGSPYQKPALESISSLLFSPKPPQFSRPSPTPTALPAPSSSLPPPILPSHLPSPPLHPAPTMTLFACGYTTPSSPLTPNSASLSSAISLSSPPSIYPASTPPPPHPLSPPPLISPASKLSFLSSTHLKSRLIRVYPCSFQSLISLNLLFITPLEIPLRINRTPLTITPRLGL